MLNYDFDLYNWNESNSMCIRIRREVTLYEGFKCQFQLGVQVSSPRLEETDCGIIASCDNLRYSWSR